MNQQFNIILKPLALKLLLIDVSFLYETYLFPETINGFVLIESYFRDYLLI